MSDLQLERLTTAVERLADGLIALASGLRPRRDHTPSDRPVRVGGQVSVAGEWLSINEVAQVAGVSAKTIRRAIAQANLKASRLGGGRRPTYRVARQDVDDWLKGNAAGWALPAAPEGQNGKYRSRHFENL